MSKDNAVRKYLVSALITLLLISMFYASSALAQTTCSKTKDCELEIKIKIAFSGANDTYINRAKDEIESVWNGPDGYQTTGDCKCKVRFKVETMKITNASQVNCNPPPTGYHCVMVTPWSTKPPFYYENGTKKYVVAYMGYNTQSPSQGGASIDGWWSDSVSRPVPGGSGDTYKDAAHEAGHMMGLDDKDGDGLMTHTNGTNAKPTQDNIDTAVKNVCGADACPDKCCCGNGEIEKGKGEECDPFAMPDGCTAGKACCPVCCGCYAPSCDTSKGEYASKQECEQKCSGNMKRCYKNYKTGCWDCVDLAAVAEELKDDTTRKNHIDNMKTSQWLFPDTEEWESLAEDMPEWPVTPEEWEKGVCGHIEPASRQAVSADSITYIYTSYLATIPVISNFFADEKINIYVDGESVYSIVTEDKMIKDVYEYHLDDPTMNIYTDTETSEKVASGELDIIDALEDGSINYEGVGFANSLKFGIANVLFDTYTFLSKMF